ncbi:MAG: heavy-metal-associated domain-containing protein [Nitrospiraceae bacterium]|nr:MAG: heavy-metal-associated domain-containing protein [Nitrospiraceae bacterium]
MAEITLKIEGMTCQHCVMNIKKAIDGIAGVKSSEVSIGNAKVVYDEPQTNKDEIEKTIQNSGYKITG